MTNQNEPRFEITITDVLATTGPIMAYPFSQLFGPPMPTSEAERLCLASWVVARLRSNDGSADAARTVEAAAAGWSCHKCGATDPSVAVTDGAECRVLLLCPVCNRGALLRARP